jgi:cysteinyl-tRNA synthetase
MQKVLQSTERTEVRLHNTMSRQVDELQPLNLNEITLYTCGPTVYDYLQIGNWTAFVRWDILVRTLRENGYGVNWVMNITDVGHLTSDADEGEDKLEKGAKREGKTAWEVAEYYTNDFLEGMKALNITEPNKLPKATDHIAEQIDLVKKLEEKGFTYSIDDGVYYDTSKLKDYGKLARLNAAELRAGARVKYNEQKRSPTDFALWKFSPADENRDMEWDSPWGKGFPGWHLECSAMAMKYLGETLDIHAGGIDHIPVHHTNEIAQSEAVTGKPFANIWLHSNFITVEGVKLSKSLSNSYTLHDIADKGYDPLTFRMFILQSHYRTQNNFSWDNLESAKNRLNHWRNIASMRWQTHDRLRDDNEKSTDDKSVSLYATSQAIIQALNDDLNTPEALKIIEDAFNKLENAKLDDIHQHALVSALETIDETLGVKLLESTPDISDEQKQLILERERAREGKDWQTSDKIRKQLDSQEIALRDTSSGPVWERNI